MLLAATSKQCVCQFRHLGMLRQSLILADRPLTRGTFYTSPAPSLSAPTPIPPDHTFRLPLRPLSPATLPLQPSHPLLTCHSLPPSHMIDLSRHRTVLRLIALGAVLGAVSSFAYSISRSRTAATLIPLTSPRPFPTSSLVGFPQISLTLPKTWAVVHAPTASPYGGPFLVATEPGTAPRPGTALAPPGPRTFLAEIHRTPSILPPLTFLRQTLNYQAPGERATIAGLPAAVIGLAANTPPPEIFSPPSPTLPTDSPPRPIQPQDPTTTWSFNYVAAVILPSGDTLLLKLHGPGRGSISDVQLFNRLLNSISLPPDPSFPAPPTDSPSYDPLDQLRKHPVFPPSDIAAPSNASGPHRTREHAIISTASDIQTVELFSSYLPPLPPLPPPAPSAPTPLPRASPTTSPPFGADIENHPATAALREIAVSHDNRFASSAARRISPTRLLLTLPDNLAVPAIMVLAVYADPSPGASLAAILVARGQSSTAAELTRLLVRAADRLSFASSSDDLPAFLSAGQTLAAAATVPPAEDLAIAFSAPSTATAAFALVRVTADGTLESRRPTPAPHRAFRSARLTPGNQITVTTTRQVFANNTFLDLLPRSFTFPANYLAPPDTSPFEPDGTVNFLKTSRYVPAHRLFLALPLLGDTPALVVTDAVPLLDLDNQARLSFLFIQPFPPTSKPNHRSYALQHLGTGRTLIASYDKNNALVEVRLPGFARGKPLSERDARRLESGW